MNTNKLEDFGFCELKEAAMLLTAYVEADKNILSDGVKLEFNKDSGMVFLTDEDYNVAMLVGKELEKFWSCFECGNEGFQDEFEKSECKGCEEIRKEVNEDGKVTTCDKCGFAFDDLRDLNKFEHICSSEDIEDFTDGEMDKQYKVAGLELEKRWKKMEEIKKGVDKDER